MRLNNNGPRGRSKGNRRLGCKFGYSANIRPPVLPLLPYFVCSTHVSILYYQTPFEMEPHRDETATFK